MATSPTGVVRQEQQVEKKFLSPISDSRVEPVIPATHGERQGQAGEVVGGAIRGNRRRHRPPSTEVAPFRRGQEDHEPSG